MSSRVPEATRWGKRTVPINAPRVVVYTLYGKTGKRWEGTGYRLRWFPKYKVWRLQKWHNGPPGKEAWGKYVTTAEFGLSDEQEVLQVAEATFWLQTKVTE